MARARFGPIKTHRGAETPGRKSFSGRLEGLRIAGNFNAAARNNRPFFSDFLPASHPPISLPSSPSVPRRLLGHRVASSIDYTVVPKCLRTVF